MHHHDGHLGAAHAALDRAFSDPATPEVAVDLGELRLVVFSDQRKDAGEQEGIAPLSAGGTVYSDEREILNAERDYWQPRVTVHFGAKLLQWAMFDFGQGTPRVLVVLNPTARKQTLRALDMRATVVHEQFFQFQHGDGRLKLIERLAAAYRGVELPDYMLEFVDSLTTRVKSGSS